MRGCAGASVCQSRAGGGIDGSQWEAAPWCCADSGHSVSASCSATVTRAATPPTATAPTAIKRRFPHFQQLCGKKGRCWEGFRSWVGQQHLQMPWCEEVVSQTCFVPPGCPGVVVLGSALSLTPPSGDKTPSFLE